MNPIKIKNINNIANIYIIRDKVKKSLLYEFIYPIVLLFIGVCVFYMLGGGNTNFENIIKTSFAGWLTLTSMILFVVALLLSIVLRIVVTINAMNSSIFFFTSINEQQYLTKIQFSKFMYIIYWISLILVFIPSFYILGYLVCVIIASLNLYICYSIVSKINVVESDFFSIVSKINKPFNARDDSWLENPWIFVLFISFIIVKIVFFSTVINEIWKLFTN